MSRLFQIPLALRLILPFTVYGFSKTPPPQNELPDLRITIRVFNYAKMSPQTWAFAETVAARIFRQAGTETLWLDCSLSAEGTYSLPVCDQPPERTALILRIVPASPATRINFGDDILGIAAQSEKGTPASATVFYDRVEQLARGGGASAEAALGHAVAHEIGHLLLGSNSHSPMGLMRARWSRWDLQSAADGGLLFTQQQAASIRNAVFKRHANQGHTSVESLTPLTSPR